MECCWPFPREKCQVCKKCCGCLLRQPDDDRDRVWGWRDEPGRPTTFQLPDLPPALDQGSIAACAVNACANALGVCMAKRGVPGFRASRLFLYYNTRVHVMKLRNAALDSGCNLRDVCKAACRFGVCDERLWPYERSKLKERPHQHLYNAAARCSPPFQYQSVPQSLPAIMSCVLAGFPVLMGISLFGNVHGVAHTGELDMPQLGDRERGRHAVLLCGYNLERRRFRMQNCWGPGWGDKGFFIVPFEYVLNPSLCWDLWVLL